MGQLTTVGVPDPRRLVPRTDTVLGDPRLVDAAGRLGAGMVKEAVRRAQERARRGEIAPEAVADEAVAGLPRAATSLRPVLNATGVLLHTNIGRAPLSVAAIDAMVTAAAYVDVEFDVGTGARARRGRGTLAALCRVVPAAGDVMVVNNGAAALVLATTALAAGREVVVSRGEMVEIGDGFRLPDLIASTGARLREVGTTNRTSLADYADAIGPDTGCVLKVHPSNFRVHGFTSAVSVAELARLPGLAAPIVVDIGSGLLAPDPLLPQEPDAATTLAEGADLVTCSGDKLLGGPQAGLLLGRSELIDLLRRHPLARAVRVDKLTIAALEATLRGPATPTRSALHADPARLRARCDHLCAELLKGAEAAPVGADVVPSPGAVGGGGAPGLELPGWAVALPEAYEGALRRHDPCVLARVEHGRTIVDLRCIPESADDALLEAIRTVALPERSG
jgi:L-seryl-tRNA(Ser) seleniumtransferase